jgi:2-hydroxycyclohexanecarboxyl-CoA dehydrogenase
MLTSARSLEGLVSLVTGAGRGIGEAIAMRLAVEGAAVAVNDRDQEGALRVTERIRSAGFEAYSFPADVSRSDAVAALVAGVVTRCKSIDILVNNVGWNEAAWFLDTDETRWQRVIEINLLSVLLTCSRILPIMIARQRGRIINIGSATAKRGFPTEAVYSGAKGAVTAFSRSLAREVAAYGVTVNVVAPGPTETPLTAEFNQQIASDPRFKSAFPDGPVGSLVRDIPIGRMGRPEDIAEAVAFLARAEAGFITGQTLGVDGGYTM